MVLYILNIESILAFFVINNKKILFMEMCNSNPDMIILKIHHLIIKNRIDFKHLELIVFIFKNLSLYNNSITCMHKSLRLYLKIPVINIKLSENNNNNDFLRKCRISNFHISNIIILIFSKMFLI